MPHGSQPDDFRAREFQELRATIRERGHVRVIVSVLTFVSWAAVVTAAFGRLFAPLSLVPLLVLAAGFEAVYALHVSVERIGRYLFVFYERADGMPKWETAIAAFGQTDAARATGGTALFAPVFVLAALLNLALAWAARSAEPTDAAGVMLAGVAVGHALFVARVLSARAKAARQRQLDTAAFQSVANGTARSESQESN